MSGKKKAFRAEKNNSELKEKRPQAELSRAKQKVPQLGSDSSLLVRSPWSDKKVFHVTPWRPSFYLISMDLKEGDS